MYGIGMVSKFPDKKMEKIVVSIHGYTLHRTCYACPEQYDVFDVDGNMVAYLRLRHGAFRVDVPDCGGDTILSEGVEDDGIFSDKNRRKYLVKAIKRIQQYYLNQEWMVEDTNSEEGVI